MNRLNLSLTALVLAMSAGAHAAPATPAIGDLERRLDDNARLIQKLSEKVQQLEAQNAQPASPAAPQEDRIQAIEQQLAAASANRAPADNGLSLRGFADVQLAASRPGSRRGAALGNVDFYLTPQFGANVKSLIELVFETGEDGELAFDMERLQVGYTFNDYLTVWAGRFHTPYGYWNTAYHHGAQIQTSIQRPRFLDFEDAGGILPAHGVGAWGTGSIRALGGRVQYDAYVTNAAAINREDASDPASGVLNPNLAGATNHNAMVGGKVAYEFGGKLQGLTVGVHGLTARIDSDGAAPDATRVNMLGGYATYLENNWEVLGEYYGFRNKNITGVTGKNSSWAGYVQAGYNIGALTPFVRAERASLSQDDNYFAAQASGQSYDRAAAGLRYDLDAKAAVKVELSHTRFTDRATGNSNEIRAQYAIRF